MGIINDNELGRVKILSHPLTNEIKYIGKTINSLDKRLKSHLEDAVNNKKRNYKSNWIKSLLNINLVPLIELVDIVEKENWRFWEMHYISLFKSWGFYLTNSTIGGDGVELTPEIKEKLLKNLKVAMQNFKGDNNVSKRSEVKEKIKNKMLGRIISKEWKEKISNAKKGKKLNEKQYEHILQMSENNKGNKYHLNVSKESRQKGVEKRLNKYKTGELIHGMTGKTHSDEVKKILSKLRKGKVAWSKKVKQTNLITNEIEFWESANDANKFYFGKSGDRIASFVKKNKIYKKIKFEYINAK